MEDASLSTGADPTSARIVEAIADAVDADPATMRPPLYDVIDPDCLDRLFSSDAVTEVAFEYDGRAVVVRADEILVDGVAYDA